MKTIHASTQPGRRLLRTMSTFHGIRSMTETDSCKQRTEILDSQSQSRNKKSRLRNSVHIAGYQHYGQPVHETSRAKSDGIMLAVMRDEDEDEDG